MRSAFFVIALALSSCGREAISTTAPVIDVQPLALDFGPIPVGISFYSLFCSFLKKRSRATRSGMFTLLALLPSNWPTIPAASN